MSRYEHAMRQWRSGVESRRRVESCIGAHGSALHMPDFALLLLQIIYSQLWTSDLPAIFIFAESCAKCFFLKKRRVERQKPGRVICSMGQARFRVFRQSDNMFGCLVCVRSSTHQSIIAGPAYEQEQPPKKKKKKKTGTAKERKWSECWCCLLFIRIAFTHTPMLLLLGLLTLIGCN